MCFVLLFSSDIMKLEVLQELNVSGNKLSVLPVTLGCLNQLVVLRAHSNHLRKLPDFRDAVSLRVGVFNLSHSHMV